MRAAAAKFSTGVQLGFFLLTMVLGERGGAIKIVAVRLQEVVVGTESRITVLDNRFGLWILCNGVVMNCHEALNASVRHKRTQNVQATLLRFEHVHVHPKANGRMRCVPA